MRNNLVIPHTKKQLTSSIIPDSMTAFPPISVQTKKPFGIQPWSHSEENIGNLLMVSLSFASPHILVLLLLFSCPFIFPCSVILTLGKNAKRSYDFYFS